MQATVLLVEDDLASGEALKVFLEEELQVRVLWVRSASEAESIIAQSSESFLAGIFDRNVLGGTTDELVRKFNQAEPTASTIAISGEVDNQAKLTAAGCMHQYQKPLTSQNLTQIAEKLKNAA